jgi:rhodanese-related sulfurtransferase
MSSNIKYILTSLVLNCLILSSASYGYEKDGLWFDRAPHCGLYCVYAAAGYLGADIDFVDLVKPEYVGRAKGSSLNELLKCVEDVGMKGKAIRNIDSRLLSRTPFPLILHVRNDYASRDYSHYVLCIGTENHKAIVLDSSGKRLVSFGDLLPLMDGVGIVVSPEPIDLGSLLAPARKRLVLYTGLAFALILMLRWAKRLLPLALLHPLRNRIALSIAQAPLFALAALLFGFLYHFTNDAGLLANHTATAAIQRAHLPNFIPKITEKKLRRLLAAGAVRIDARVERDFERGHIENAVSIPINASPDERAKAAAGIPKDARIVVYCQSAACRFADKIAVKLIDVGFSNISIYRPGWNDWRTKHPTPAATGDTAAQTPSPNTPAQDTSAATEPSQDAS